MIEFASKCIDCGGEFFTGESPSEERCLFCATCLFCDRDLEEWELGRFCSAACCLDYEAAIVALADGSARRLARAVVAREYRGDSRIALHERDGWRCYLCGDAVDQRARHPEPLSAVLDHVVPVAKGGLSTEENLRTAHSVCNARKSDMDLELFLSKLAPLVLPA